MTDPRNDAQKTTGRPILDIDPPTPKTTPEVPTEQPDDEEIVRDTAVQGGED